MNFQRTTASLFQATQEMTIHREHDIAQLLMTYEQQLESGDLPDRSLLIRARVLVEQRLRTGMLDHEFVELAHNLYRSSGAWIHEICLLRRYIKDGRLQDTTKAWAWWHVVDCLALCQRDREAVHEQQALWLWSTQTFPLEECWFVLSDGTQANCWGRSGCVVQWFTLYDDMMQRSMKTEKNWLDRFYCVRTASHLCFRSKDEERLQAILEQLIDLEQESVEPEVWVQVEVQILFVCVAQMQEAWGLMRERAEKAIDVLRQWEPHIVTSTQRKQFRSLCHNIAAPLYRAQIYDLAIPLFQKSITYHANPYYAYLWCAASLWATTHQRQDVFPLLQQAAARYDGVGDAWDCFQNVVEFRDVQHDQEFQAVVDAGMKKQ